MVLFKEVLLYLFFLRSQTTLLPGTHQPSHEFFSEQPKLSSSSSSYYIDFCGFLCPYVLSSFHDLLLVQRSCINFYACNPLTRQSIALPEAPALELEEEDYNVYRCGMMCEPNCSCGVSYYCSCSIKYKVALLTANDMNDPISRVLIFSSEIGQ
ncbi:hypothetical protein TorRG33x02_034570 [Trema orientale]|uniref:Uncharacterized protein n=1 Tax=Trema orientale TaxID=63057 RepID=A0A2P5FSQ5_TREOI|nr:hypothetical protein TorRG33x02_034570 [Trema orientale]